GRSLEFAGPEFLFDVPARTTVSGRIEKGALQRCHCPVDGALAPARHAGKGIFGGATENSAITRRERTSEARNQLLDIVGGGGHETASRGINWPPTGLFFLLLLLGLRPAARRAALCSAERDSHATDGYAGCVCSCTAPGPR